jgi:large subunit ribosomal protein L10
MARPEKVQRVAELAEEFKGARNIFITDYSGLNVIDITELRKQLRESGISYRVEKNTLLRRAATDVGCADLVPLFKGPTAIAFSAEDPTVAAKIFHDFYDRLDKPRVRMFRIEDRLYEPDKLAPLAKLPPREIVLSQLVAVIESPISALIGTLDAIIREFVATVDAIAEKKKEAGDVLKPAADAAAEEPVADAAEVAAEEPPAEAAGADTENNEPADSEPEKKE